MSARPDKVGVSALSYGERDLISQFIGQAFDAAQVPVWISTVGERGLSCSQPAQLGGSWMVVIIAGFYLGDEGEDYLAYGVPARCKNGEAFIALAMVRFGDGVEIQIRDISGVPLGLLVSPAQKDLLAALLLNWEHAAHLATTQPDF